MSAESSALAEVAIVATGSYLPRRVVSNHELAVNLHTSDAWIRERTGIETRHVAAPTEATSDLGIQASRHALDDAGIAAEELSLVVCATSSPDWPQPATAAAIHGGLGMRTAAGALDVGVVCSGWVVALQLAAAQLAAMPAWDHVLVVGAECYSRIVNPNDRTTAVFFGDGAGAAVLSRIGGAARPGALRLASFQFGTDFTHHAVIRVPAGGTREPVGEPQLEAGRGFFHMDGPAVKGFAVPQLAAVVTEACTDAGIAPADLALLIPHQSNLRILEAAAGLLGLPLDRVVTTVQQTANTAGASIPIALDAARRADRVRSGDRICIAGYGGGLSWAAAVLAAD